MSELNMEALFEDVDYQAEEDLPLQFDLDFEVEGDSVYGSIYTPSPSFGSRRPVVLFFHGFTGFVRMDDVLMALLRAGCVVASVHHRGSWGSQGKYLFSNCIEDAAKLADWARSPEFCERYGTDPGSVFLMGHSLGCNTVLHALCRAEGVRGAMLLTPCDIAALMDGMSDIKRAELLAGNGVEVLSYDGIPALLDDVSANAGWMRFESAAERLPECPLLVVTASKDPICPAETMVDPFLSKLQERGFAASIVHKEYFARHSLMGVRVRLTKDVASFIEEVLEG